MRAKFRRDKCVVGEAGTTLTQRQLDVMKMWFRKDLEEVKKRVEEEVKRLREEKMFWVYENWRARGHKAVLHRGQCLFCNDGRGLSGQGTSPDNGRWLGPFENIDQASQAAHNTGAAVTRHRCV